MKRSTPGFDQFFCCVCADIALPLEFLGKAQFDLIVCKGLLDAILSNSCTCALSMVMECTRCLFAPAGQEILFLVTFSKPDSRLEFLEYQNELSHYFNLCVLGRSHNSTLINAHFQNTSLSFGRL